MDSGQIERTGEAGISVTLIGLGSTLVQSGDFNDQVIGVLLILIGFAVWFMREHRKPNGAA